MQLYKIPVLFDCVRRHGRRTRSDERKRVKSPCIGASARAASAKKAKNLHEAEKRRHASTRGARRRGHKGAVRVTHAPPCACESRRGRGRAEGERALKTAKRF